MSYYLNTDARGVIHQIGECLPTAAEGSFRCAMARAARQIAIWDQRYRQRRALRELSPEILQDIGVSREDALLEAAKPFWIA